MLTFLTQLFIMMKYIIGCSGFHYKHWKGKFYPADLAIKKWFEYYGKHFQTLELNVTFYRFPTPAMLREWYEHAPANFSFSVKVPRSITHFKKLNDTSRMISDFYLLISEGLQEKLGCVLFQFPPNFSYNDLHLTRILKSVNHSFKNVVEFRHQSWWNEAAIRQLGEKNIAFCGMSHPDFPNQLICNTSHLYYRMHGSQQLYTSDYTQDELAALVDKIQQFKQIKSAYIYFNNDVDGFAPRNALTMVDLISKL